MALMKPWLIASSMLWSEVAEAKTGAALITTIAAITKTTVIKVTIRFITHHLLLL